MSYIERLIDRAKFFHRVDAQLPLWLVAELHDAGIIIDELEESFN